MHSSCSETFGNWEKEAPVLFLMLGYSAGIKTRTFQVYSCQQHLWLPQPLSSEVCGKVHYGQRERESWLEKLVVFSFFGVLYF